MKKFAVSAVIVLIVMTFSYCSHSKKATAAAPVVHKVTYESDIKPLIVGKCSPCHIPASGGNKKALDTYVAAKDNADDMVHRVDLTPGERGFMPFKKAKLSDSTIMVFKQWKADGLLEK
jgi:hypothetical protein